MSKDISRGYEWISRGQDWLIEEVLDNLKEYEAYVQLYTHTRGHKSPEGIKLQESFRKLQENLKSG